MNEYFRLLIQGISRPLRNSMSWLLNKLLLVFVAIYLTVVFYMIPGWHQEVSFRQTILLMSYVLLHVLWWFLLGVASSIGLGSGLHTFVLYLGPYIAKVSIVSNDCGYVPAFEPSRWNFKTFGDCTSSGSEVGFFSILWAVEIECLLWGIGTAMGELPPYFIAKSAREAKRRLEIEEMEGGRFERCKQCMHRSLQNYACITVLLCASIPNPFFDLAGLLCGHFGVPLSIFLASTLVGKAFIKVHIQTVVIILIFTGSHIEGILKKIENTLPFLGESLSNWLENEKQSLHTSEASNGSWLGFIWNCLIFALILMFLVSFCNAIVKRERQEEQQQQLKYII